MSKRYLTLGTDVLDTQGYDVIATAKSDALAQHIAEEMNKAAELEQVKVERDAMREALQRHVTYIELDGYEKLAKRYGGCEHPESSVWMEHWLDVVLRIPAAAALKDAK